MSTDLGVGWHGPPVGRWVLLGVGRWVLGVGCSIYKALGGIGGRQRGGSTGTAAYPDLGASEVL